MYRKSSQAFSRKQPSKLAESPSLLDQGVAAVFHMAYFTLLPILVTVALNWVAYAFTAYSFYQMLWMSPLLLLLSTFLAGVLIRQKMESEMGGCGLLVVALLALCLFAWLTYQDIQTIGSMYSRFMPKYLLPSVTQYVYMLPGIGLMGMLFYRHFTLKP